MKTLYIIYKFLTFPGAYIRGIWEHLICRFLKVMIEPGGYLRPDEACGHVEHSLAKKPVGAFFLATLPGFLNFNMGIWFYLLGIANLRYMGITVYDSVPLFIIYILSAYLGFSLLCSLFPLTEDALNCWELCFRSEKKKKNVVKAIFGVFGKIIAFIPSLIARIGAFLEKNCITFLILTAVTVLIFVLK